MPTERNRAPRRELITVNEFAARCSVHHKTVRRWIRDGVVPAYRLPMKRNSIRLDSRDVELVTPRVRPEEAGIA